VGNSQRDAASSRRSTRRQGGSSRTPRGGSSARPLVEARLRVRIPKGFAWRGFTAAHPELVVEANNRYTSDPHHVVVEVQIRGGEEHDWAPELRATTNIVSVHDLPRIGRPNAYRVTWEAPVYYTALLNRFDLIGAVPFVLSGEYVSLSVAMAKNRLQSFVGELRRRGFELEITEMRPFRARVAGGGLTPKQRVRFQTAVETGFFDVPRRVTLDELARRYSVRKSAFAESLALARQKILIAAGRALASGDEAARAAFFGTP
jgi:predicted DNA binding protein